MQSLLGKKILLGVSGSIAAYKAVILLRGLQKSGATVRVIMTPAATKFVTPLTFEAITHTPVHSELVTHQSWNNHIDISLWADAFVIAPATANTIAKLVHGLADDMLSTAYLASRCPVFLAPSMDVDMWHHIVTQNNIALFKSNGGRVIPVGNGYLASGLTGEGRMAEPEDIVDALTDFFSLQTSLLSGKKVLITAGPTYENIDPVRFIGNASTGKMGVAIADAIAKKGGLVTLILGPSNITPGEASIKIVNVRSAQEMFEEADKIHSETDISIFSAAVADYRPMSIAKEKIKKSSEDLTIKLIKNPDIAYELGKKKTSQQIHIGFALESTTGEEYAREKLERKNFDLVILNSLTDKGAGFGGDTNKTTFFYRNNKSKKFELKSKTQVAQDIVLALEDFLISNN
ncbi:MAG: bifunctional phosphopantothenoylcysteine decarboxylase/phosphopantothenate--cysteine ligase CoaBC [Saprospiraceae bacterium]